MKYRSKVPVYQRHLEYFSDLSSPTTDDCISYFRTPGGFRDISKVIALHTTSVDCRKRMLAELEDRQHSLSTLKYLATSASDKAEAGSQQMLASVLQHHNCIGRCAPAPHVIHHVTAPISGCRLPTAIVSPIKRTDLTVTSFDTSQSHVEPTWRQACGVHLPPFETFRAHAGSVGEETEDIVHRS
jgi:hypothetical protein